MTHHTAIFKANDIRGIYGDTLNDDTAYRIGLALAQSAAAQHIQTAAVGRDGRLSSPALAAALGDGLRQGGVNVLDVGLVPTPALYYAAVRHCDGSGIMVTGSHNPKNYNGFKIMMNRATLMGDGIAALREAVMQGSPAVTGNGRLATRCVMDEFIAEVAAVNPLARPLKLVIDAGNGATGDYAPALFRALGCEVTPLFCDIDGNFPNHHPDPAQPENLRDAAAALQRHACEAAFAFDGDGDRLGVLPAGREPIFADRLLMLYARDLLSRQQAARVVFDVKCSALLAPWIERHGGIPDMQPTGHAFIKACMARTGALLGGEMSGHFYFRENWYGFDDALFAAARVAAILSRQPDAFDDIPDSLASPELHVDMTGKDQHRFIADLSAGAEFPEARQVVTIDGLRVEYEDGFGLVRASNTTSALVLRFEARDEAGMARIQACFRRLLTEADSGLQLPF